MPGWRDLPAQFRHCVVAVYNKSTGGGPDGVVRAMRICRDTLAKWGYLFPAGKNEVLEGIQLTGKGWVKNMEHLREGMEKDKKDLAFAKLFKMVEPRLYELDGPGGKKPPKDVKQAQREEKIQAKDDPSPVLPEGQQPKSKRTG